MLNTDLFTGKLVRLAAPDLDVMVKAFARHHRDSEYLRLSDSEPAYPHSEKAIRAFFEADQGKDPPGFYMFLICRKEDGLLMGDVGLGGIDWVNGDAFVGIGLGERDCWGKGYGTEAMQLVLRYAFTELNLQRVTLTVFEYNARAVKSYEKAGFQHEGRERGCLQRDGERADILWMGIRREEWLQRQATLSEGSEV